MPTFPRSAITAVGCAVLLASLTACGSSSSAKPISAPVGPASGTITWYANQFGPTSTDVRKTLIAAFEKANPKIKVKLEQAPSDSDAYRSTLTTQISGGSSSFDVYNGDVVWPAQFGKAGLAEPLSGKLPSSYWKTFSPGLVDGLTYKGKIMAAPCSPTTPSSTTARTCSPRPTCRFPPPGSRSRATRRSCRRRAWSSTGTPPSGTPTRV